MAIIPNLTPGAFLEHQDVSFSFSADVKEVAVTTGNIPPSISKYIAYDTLVPPNPFLAVTEDGRGRVVYDGGFPKFYNGTSYNNATTFAQLNGSCKFLHNAINWVANAQKFAAANRKVLVLGDATDTDYYWIKSTAEGSFYNTLQQVARVAGVQMTYKDSKDYGGKLNPRLAELEQYALVIFFGSAYTDVSLITPESVNDMVSYRENGNGIIMITDHGLNYNSVEAAQNSHGFFCAVNKVATRFGAYFTGDFNRTPVSVGFLRQNYGNHPLYANLADSEQIIAGGSESKVVVSSLKTYAPANAPVIRTTVKGINTYNVLALKNDGSIETARFVYIVQGDDFLWIDKDPDTPGQPGINPGEVIADKEGNLVIDAVVDGSALGTVWGELLKNGVRVGEIYYADNKSNLFIYGGGSSIKTRDGDVIELRISTPFTYSKVTTVRRKEANLSKVARAAINNSIATVWEKSYLTTPLLKHHNSIVEGTSLDKKAPITEAGIRLKIANIFENRTGSSVYRANIYATLALLNAAIAANPVIPGECYVNAEDASVYAYVSGKYSKLPAVTAKDIFPPPCVLSNGTSSWKMDLSGKLTKET